MQRFELTQAHIRLLRHANIVFREGMCWGEIGLDQKRPFGNSDIVGDMAELLAIRPVLTDDEETHWPPGTTDRMTALYRELGTALQQRPQSPARGPGRVR